MRDEPERAARQLVEGGFAQHYDIALQLLTELPYNRLARARPGGLAALLRALAARVRTDRATPNKIIAEGTDWRFLNELKRELKA